MKEHAGGTPDVGHISLSTWEEERFAVPVEHFDFSSFDKPQDFVIEAVQRGEDIGPLLNALMDRASAIRTASKIASVISMMMDAKNPRMICHQILWATGMTLMDGEPAAALARRYGVSKQAFEQGALRVCSKLDLRPCRNMRDEKARANMSKRNFRK